MAEDAIKTLRQRRLAVVLIVLIAFFLLVGFNLGSWIFLMRMEDRLDVELGKRLRAVASLTVRMVEGEVGIDLFPSEANAIQRLIIQDILVDVREENELEGVYIFDEGYRVLVDSRESARLLEKRSYLEEDREMIARAWRGEIVASPLYRVAGHPFKNGYGGVSNSVGRVVGILAVEGNADFFDVLGQFRRGLWVGGGVSVLVILVLFFFLYRAVGMLIQTHDKMEKSERLALLGQMAAGVAHEIRNPLGIIRGTAEVLRDRYNPKEKPDALFEYIPMEVRRLSKMVNDFLTFARDRDLVLRQGQLNDVIDEVLDGLEKEFRETGTRVVKVLDPDLPEFSFDADGMTQVLLNLFLNGHQAMPDGGTMRVGSKVVSSGKDGEYVVVEIADEGRGIEGDTEKLFEPFYTTRESGSGLGLAITRRIVEKHGGWVRIESVARKGTTVRLGLLVGGRFDNGGVASPSKHL